MLTCTYTTSFLVIAYMQKAVTPAIAMPMMPISGYTCALNKDKFELTFSHGTAQIIKGSHSSSQSNKQSTECNRRTCADCVVSFVSFLFSSLFIYLSLALELFANILLHFLFFFFRGTPPLVTGRGGD